MTSTQGRLADTIDVFYSAADKASESAMAAHAYKRSVDDLDTGIGRELVRLHPHTSTAIRMTYRGTHRKRLTAQPLWNPSAR